MRNLPAGDILFGLAELFLPKDEGEERIGVLSHEKLDMLIIYININTNKYMYIYICHPNTCDV